MTEEARKRCDANGRRWRAKMKAQGRCINCGLRCPGFTMCLMHRMRRAVAFRIKYVPKKRGKWAWRWPMRDPLDGEHPKLRMLLVVRNSRQTGHVLNQAITVRMDARSKAIKLLVK